MRRIKANYHTLQILKNAKPKLRKAIISNCNYDLLYSISECVLNVLNGNIYLSDCAKRKLRKYKSSLSSLVDRRMTRSAKIKLIVQRGGFLLPILSAVLPALAGLLFRTRDKRHPKNTDSTEDVLGSCRPQPQPPPPVKTRPSVKTKRVTKEIKNNVTTHPHDKWVALRTKLLDADIKETDFIHKFADFLHIVLSQAAPQKEPQQRPLTETRPTIEMLDIAETPQRSLIVTQAEPPSVDEESASYEVSKRRLISSGRDDGEKSYGDDDV